jgi:hypothetical protein
MNDTMRIKENLLFAKSEDGVTGVFVPALGEIETDGQEIGISEVSSFLDLMSMFGEDHLIEKDGNVLILKDDKKKVKYLDTPLESIEELKSKGIQLFNAAEKRHIVTVLDEVVGKELSTVMKKLSLDKVSLKTDESGEVYIVASNDNENSVEFKLEGNGEPNQTFNFGSGSVFSYTFAGIYTIDIRSFETGHGEKPFAMLHNKSISEGDGDLRYFVGLESE